MAVKFEISDDFIRAMRRMSKTSEEFRGHVEKTLLKCGDALNKCLLDEVEKSDVLSDDMKERLAREIDNKIVHSSNFLVQSEAGWLFEKYVTVDPPTGVLAIWHNYGTKERKTAAGYNRGFVHPAKFVKRARERASKQIENIQKDMMKEVEEKWLKID